MSEDSNSNDVLYMTDRRRTYMEPETGDLLFLEWSTHDDGWMPAKVTMSAWQQGRLRIYYPTNTDQPMMITMPGAEKWPFLQPTEEPDVRGVMTRPWIPDGQAIEGVREQDIAAMDRTYEVLSVSASSSSASSASEIELFERFEIHRIPTLVIPMSYDLIPVRRPPPPQRPPPAVPSDPTHLKPFPRHLVAAVLANAVANNAICPITMDPITPETATVTSCGHVFQTEAIRYWLTTNAICPECRDPMCI
jgi:hypothetical protein